MAHNTIKPVLDALPFEEKEIWKSERKSLIQNYIWYPDGYMSASLKEKKMIAPYAYTIRGRDFHYFSVEQDTFEGIGTWQTNIIEKWRFTMRGINYYLSSIVKSLKKGEITHAAKFMGWLCHVLQDQAAFFHSMEGPEGTHPFIFNVLFPTPQNKPQLNPVSLLADESTPDIQLKGYKPRLLGTSLAEAGFHLFHRFMNVKNNNRRLLIPLIQNIYAHNKSKEKHIRQEIGIKVGKILLDLFHTVFCLAQKRFQKKDIFYLTRIDVTELCPLEYPNHLSSPYRFAPVVKNFALNNERNPVPLVLRDGGKKVQYRCGFGTGSHVEYVISYGIPKGVFQLFEVRAGLHAKFGKKGRIKITVYLNKQLKFEKVFIGSESSKLIKVDIRNGGILSLHVKNLLKDWSDTNNHVVWAEPCLIKKKAVL